MGKVIVPKKKAPVVPKAKPKVNKPKPKAKADPEEQEEVKSKATDTEEELEDEDWFAVGDDEDEKFKSSGLKNRGFRVQVGYGEERDVTFLSDKPLTVREHSIYTKKKISQREFTCLEKTKKGRCPFCEINMRNANSVVGKSAVVKAFWVIDHKPYEKKDGTKVKQSVKILAMKTKSYNPLKKILAKTMGDPDFSFRGIRVTLMRSESSTSPGTGDSFYVVDTDAKIPTGEQYDKSLVDLKKEFAPQERETLLTVAEYVEGESSNQDED